MSSIIGRLSGTTYRAYLSLMRKPKILLMSIFAIVAILSVKIPQLKIDASSDSLVLQGDQSLVIYRQMAKRYGSSDFVLVTYSPENDLYAQETLDNIAALQKELEAIDGVKSVVSFLDVPLLYSPKVNLSNFSDGVNYLRDKSTDRQLARQEFLNSPVYKQLLTSQSENTTALQVNLEAADDLREQRFLRDELRALDQLNHKQRRQLQAIEKRYEATKQQRNALEKHLVASVRTVLEKYRADNTKIFLGGVPMIISDMLDFVRSDMLVFGTAILIFIIF